MRGAWLLVLCGGCCVDTYMIVNDTSAQPVASVTYGPSGAQPTYEAGELSTIPVGEAGFDTTLVTTDRFVLHVPEGASGSVAATLDAVFAGTAQTVPVTATVNVEIDQVCLEPDQADYGTPRCGDTYIGTVDIQATGTSIGDVMAHWVLHQVAVVAKGTPDC